MVTSSPSSSSDALDRPGGLALGRAARERASGSGSSVTPASGTPRLTVIRAACGGRPGTGTWQSRALPSVAAPSPSRRTVPATGPPTARISTAPEGSSSMVAGAVC